MTRAEGRRVEKMTDTTDVGFYNAQDGTKGRDGGPYLDHVQRQAAEIQRAKVEGREPANLDGPLPATVGTVLLVKEQIVDNSFSSNPSMRDTVGNVSDPIVTVAVSNAPDDGIVVDAPAEPAASTPPPFVPPAEPVSNQ